MVLSNECLKEVVSKKKNIRSLSYKNGVALLKRNEFIKLLLLINKILYKVEDTFLELF